MNESDTGSTGQVNSTAAEVYEEFFVPALFGQWPDTVLDAAHVRPGDEVLDIGCGTGVLARAATERVGSSGSVTGVDVNEGMLAVAQRSSSEVDWRRAAAEDLPFGEGSFDRVVSQFALMFFVDTSTAMSEMLRVTRPGGTLAVATWAAVDKSPGYDAMIQLLRRLFGDPAADALNAPFTLGTEDLLLEAMHGVPNVEVSEHAGTATFASLEAWLHTDVRGWTLADIIDDNQYDELRAAAADELAAYVQDDGRVSFSAPALIATATLPIR